MPTAKFTRPCPLARHPVGLTPFGTGDALHGLVRRNPAARTPMTTLSGRAPTTLGKPENYRRLLQWLYDQPWYADGPPTDDDLEPIWGFRAALVDSFVYEPAS